MKKILMLFCLLPLMSCGQEEENEILRVSALREKFHKKLEVNVYPNPSTEGRVYISAPLYCNYELFDLSGNRVKMGVFEVEKISLEDLSSGTYILKLSHEGTEEKKKIIVL